MKCEYLKKKKKERQHIQTKPKNPQPKVFITKYY